MDGLPGADPDCDCPKVLPVLLLLGPPKGNTGVDPAADVGAPNENDPVVLGRGGSCSGLLCPKRKPDEVGIA